MPQRFLDLNNSKHKSSHLSQIVLCLLRDGVLRGDRKALARAISLCEDSPLVAAQLLSSFGAISKDSMKIGLTGPPGAGKSTLLSKLITGFAKSKTRVGAVLVDPSSPISKGAVLGDRIRLGDETLNENVFTRSLASRGSLGGLSVSASAVVRLLEHWGAHEVLIETVGIGQQGTDIRWLADVVLLILSPGIGDSIQTMKAGVFETADAYVINKSDVMGAENLAGIIESEIAGVDGSKPNVFMTNARTGEGVGVLIDWLRKHFTERNRRDNRARVEERVKHELLFLTEALLINRMLEDADLELKMRETIEEIINKRADVFTAALSLSEILVYEK